MIDLTKLTPDEAEAIAHAEGFTGVSTMFAQIGDLQHAAYVLLNEIDLYKGDLPDEVNNAIDQLRELLP